MGKGRIFAIGFCAALLWGPRTGGTGDLRMAAVEACARLRPRLSARAIAGAETLAALGWSSGR
jgi:hypothetical protein